MIYLYSFPYIMMYLYSFRFILDCSFSIIVGHIYLVDSPLYKNFLFKFFKREMINSFEYFYHCISLWEQFIVFERQSRYIVIPFLSFWMVLFQQQLLVLIRLGCHPRQASYVKFKKNRLILINFFEYSSHYIKRPYLTYLSSFGRVKYITKHSLVLVVCHKLIIACMLQAWNYG